MNEELESIEEIPSTLDSVDDQEEIEEVEPGEKYLETEQAETVTFEDAMIETAVTNEEMSESDRILYESPVEDPYPELEKVEVNEEKADTQDSREDDDAGGDGAGEEAEQGGSIQDDDSGGIAANGGDTSGDDGKDIEGAGDQVEGEAGESGPGGEKTIETVQVDGFDEMREALEQQYGVQNSMLLVLLIGIFMCAAGHMVQTIIRSMEKY